MIEGKTTTIGTRRFVNLLLCGGIIRCGRIIVKAFEKPYRTTKAQRHEGISSGFVFQWFVASFVANLVDSPTGDRDEVYD